MHIVSINHNSPCGLYLTEQGLLYWVIESMAVIGNADLPKLAIQLQPDRASPAFSATRLHQVIFIEALFLGRPKCVFTNFGPKYPCGETPGEIFFRGDTVGFALVDPTGDVFPVLFSKRTRLNIAVPCSSTSWGLRLGASQMVPIFHTACEDGELV